MTKKTSREGKTQQVRNGMELNYDFNYEYYGNGHKAERIGDMYYRYDGNGNVVEERYGGHGAASGGSGAYSYEDGVYSTDYGFALTRPGSGSGGNAGNNVYERRYTWDYRNQLLKTKDNRWTVNYRYGHDGQRRVKYTEETRNETLYFNSMWQTSTSGSGNEWLQSKHIFVGEGRIATKSNKEIGGKTEGNLSFENEHQYWYHSDHLGSAQLTTTGSGELHERAEYTPYGEIWVEHKYNLAEGSLPYRFTGKELDGETGYYYYGARYLDPRTSRWISTDPAMGEYIPSAPVDDEARKRNGNLPGMGGVFNVVNMHVYHYAGNNPVKMIDPDGRENIDEVVDSIKKGAEIVSKIGSIISKLKDPKERTIEGFYNINKEIKQTTNDIFKNTKDIINNMGNSPIFHYLAVGLTFGLIAIDEDLKYIGVDIFELKYTIGSIIGTAVKFNTSFKFSPGDENLSIKNENIASFKLTPNSSLQASIGLGINVASRTSILTFKETGFKMGLLYNLKY
jgi:RHS repeat-associated protein